MTRGNLFGYMETVQKLASYYMIIMFQKTYMNYLPEIYHADVEHQIFEYITPNVPLVSLTNVPDISLLNVPLFTGCN